MFEDDVRFRPFFHERFQYTMYEVATTRLDWDLMYVLDCVSIAVVYWLPTGAYGSDRLAWFKGRQPLGASVV